MRKRVIQERLDALHKEAAELLNAETFNVQRSDEIQTEITTLEKELKSIEALEEKTKKTALAAAAKPKAVGAEVRENLLDKPWDSAGHFFQAVREAEGQLRAGRPVDVRLASGFNEGVGNEGGFLVGTDISSNIIQQTFDQGVISSRCTTIPISSGSNGVKIPARADKTRTDGNRNGGVMAYWAAEAAAYTATTPKPFEKIELELNKLTALAYATEEVLQDAAALGAYITGALPAEMDFVLNNAILRGAGAGIPLGILNSPALITQAAEGSQTADTVNVKNVMKMYSRMPAWLKPQAVWMINSEVMPQLQLMTSDTTSAAQMVYMPPGGVSGAPYGTLFGRPVIEIEFASAIGDVGDIMLCAWGEYFLATKGGVQQQASMHVRFLYDETAFKFTLRIDGKPSWNTYLTPFKGANTQSPFVVLAAR